ncbi:MFS transporter [Saccharopolyspora sp. ASAGF58]|uniref:MFS transporter n=1 Tax=Saccharopolyspora sp. ASAGF58 TaxID=2719023 RepID=UPI001FF09625|nr:MFS transporter [Saccharopolyspora sp. ASAGF58]
MIKLNSPRITRKQWAALGALLLPVLLISVFFMTQYLQLVLGMSPLRAGFALLPGIALSVVGSLLAVRLIRRVRLAELLGAAILATSLGYLLMVLLPAQDGVWLVVVAFMVVGLGAGITETATNDTIMNSVAPENAGAASAISETGYELGAAMGTAILGSVLTAATGGKVDLAGIPESIVDTVRDTLGGALSVANELPVEQGIALQESAAHAFTFGVQVTSVVGAAILVFAAVRAWWVLSRR